MVSLWDGEIIKLHQRLNIYTNIQINLFRASRLKLSPHLSISIRYVQYKERLIKHLKRLVNNKVVIEKNSHPHTQILGLN